MADYVIPHPRLNLTNEFQHDLAWHTSVSKHKGGEQNSLVHLKMGNGIIFFLILC